MGRSEIGIAGRHVGDPPEKANKETKFKKYFSFLLLNQEESIAIYQNKISAEKYTSRSIENETNVAL